MSGYYILDDKTPVPVPDVYAYIQWCENNDRLGLEEDGRRVRSTYTCGVHVSTVFLGLNHQWEPGPPMIFETMIFGGKHAEYQERYATWADAEAGHARAVARVKGES